MEKNTYIYCAGCIVTQHKYKRNQEQLSQYIIHGFLFGFSFGYELGMGDRYVCIDIV